MVVKIIMIRPVRYARYGVEYVEILLLMLHCDMYALVYSSADLLYVYIVLVYVSHVSCDVCSHVKVTDQPLPLIRMREEGL